METDTAFFEIFEINPNRLEELINRGLPNFRSAKSHALKRTIKVECDLLFSPSKGSDPHWVVEFQMYYDVSIFNRAELAKAMVWKSLNKRDDCLAKTYEPKEVRAIVIFGDESMIPQTEAANSNVGYAVLDNQIKELKNRDPDSPLIRVLAPIFETKKQLENNASTHYNEITNNESLDESERSTLANVFLHLFTQRFSELSNQQILKMIAELTPLEKTQAGKELIEQGIEQGQEGLLVAQATKRFGKLNSDLEKKIRSLNSNRLEELALAILDFESISDMENWLK